MKLILFFVLLLNQAFAFEFVTTLPVDLEEISGMTFSRTHKGILWVHNDSDDGAYLFAIDMNGKLRGRFLVSEVKGGDWEDIASGPCLDSAGSCLFIADVGDKKGKRDFLRILIVEEPKSLVNGTLKLQREIHFNGFGHNFESLAYRPGEKDFLLIAKVGKRQAPSGTNPEIFRLDPVSQSMRKIAKLDLGGERAAGADTLVTGAGYNSVTGQLLVGTYNKYFLFDKSLTLIRSGIIPALPKAEAFTWGPEGIYVTGEDKGAELYRLAI